MPPLTSRNTALFDRCRQDVSATGTTGPKTNSRCGEGNGKREKAESRGRAGGGLQMVVADIDGDGDPDVVTPGKTGLFVAENQTKSTR